MAATLSSGAGLGANAVWCARVVSMGHSECGRATLRTCSGVHTGGSHRVGDVQGEMPAKSLPFGQSYWKGPARAAAAAVVSQGSERVLQGKERGPCIVWFKHDLRTDDHPGLVAASSYHTVIPVYVFDPVLLAGWNQIVLEALHDAVEHLRQALRLLGSDLVVRVGSAADVIAALARETGAVDIFAEVEVEHTWKEVVAGVSSSLHEGNHVVTLKHWSASLYEGWYSQDYGGPPLTFRDFQKLQVPPSSPLDSPASLPPLPNGVLKGRVPSLEEIYESTNVLRSQTSLSANLESAQDLLQVEEVARNTPSQSSGPFKSLLEWREKYIVASPYAALEKLKAERDPPKKNSIFMMAGGAAGAADALDGYLRFLEPTSRDDWLKMFEQVWSLESKQGASFRSLFGPSLTVGTLSLRRVYQKAIDYEKARMGGRLSPFGFSTFTVAATVANTKAMEWYQRLAKESQAEGLARGIDVRTWKWRNFLVEYSVAGTEGPAVVLVHGFGAFWEHYRDNIKAVAQQGNRVWALTLLGFGRSEKPDVLYTEIFWSELVRDFIAEVVREPAVVAGNSIGGYIVSVVAALWPNLVNSLVLINSAGIILPNYQAMKYTKPRTRSQLAWGGARILMKYLQNSSTRLLRMCYPVNTSRADDWLSREVARASHDPGAIAVLESIFFLQRPMPLNYLLDRFAGKVLAIQGAKDPLNNATLRGSLLETHCKNVEVRILDAGHCPHDEVPDTVNILLDKWVKNSLAEEPDVGIKDLPGSRGDLDARSGHLVTEVAVLIGDLEGDSTP